TVPVLVYLFQVDAVFATVYSLFIVGITSVAGSVSYFRKGLVHVKTAVFFGIPSVFSVYLTRVFLVPSIPDIVFQNEGFKLTKSSLLLLIFAALMLLASFSMLRKKKPDAENDSKSNEVNLPFMF